MTQNDVLQCCAALLTTCLDEEPDACPRGIVKVAFDARGFDGRMLEVVETVLLRSDLVVVGSETIRLTTAGRERARELSALVEA